MIFNLRTPCDQCPFIKSVPPFLSAASARSYAEAIVDRDKTFSCHKTLHRQKTGRHSHCAGALIFNAKHRFPNAMIRIAQYLKIWDGVLDMDTVPVFDSVEQMVEHHAKNPWRDSADKPSKRKKK